MERNEFVKVYMSASDAIKKQEMESTRNLRSVAVYGIIMLVNVLFIRI